MAELDLKGKPNFGSSVNFKALASIVGFGEIGGGFSVGELLGGEAVTLSTSLLFVELSETSVVSNDAGFSRMITSVFFASTRPIRLD